MHLPFKSASPSNTRSWIWHYAQSDTWHILTRTKIKFTLRNTHLRAFKQHAKLPLPSLSIAFVRFCQVKLDQNIYRILRYALAKSLLSHSLDARPRQSMKKIFMHNLSLSLNFKDLRCFASLPENKFIIKSYWYIRILLEASVFNSTKHYFLSRPQTKTTPNSTSRNAP